MLKALLYHRTKLASLVYFEFLEHSRLAGQTSLLKIWLSTHKNCWVPTPTIPAHTLCQSSLDELVREVCQEVNEVSFYVQKSGHISEGCIYCLVHVVQAREGKKKSWRINKWGHLARSLRKEVNTVPKVVPV